MVVFQSIILLLLFLIELAALASFGYWGYHLPIDRMARIALSIGAPLVIAVIWGLFIAPKASYPVTVPVRHLLQIVVFSLASLALYTSGQKTLALVFIGIAVVVVLLVYTMQI